MMPKSFYLIHLQGTPNSIPLSFELKKRVVGSEERGSATIVELQGDVAAKCGSWDG